MLENRTTVTKQGVITLIDLLTQLFIFRYEFCFYHWNFSFRRGFYGTITVIQRESNTLTTVC